MGCPIRVLLLEDSPEDADMIVRQLRASGLEVAVKRVDTEAAFLTQIAFPALPDIILTDYNLVDFDALEVLRHLRERRIEVPVVVISGYVTDMLASELITRGAADFLLKDRLGRLHSAVVQAMHNHRTAQIATLHHQALQALTDGIAITEARIPGHPIVQVNAAFERITGFATRDVLGRSAAMLEGEDTDPATLSRLHEALQNGAATQVLLPAHRKDGTPFWNEITLSPIRNTAGALTHFVWVLQDVTDRVRAEEERLEQEREECRKQHRFLRDVLAAVTEGKLRFYERPGAMPPPLSEQDEPIPLYPASLRPFRAAVTAAAESCAFSPERAHELAWGAGEAAMNAVVHAGGGVARISYDRSSGQVQVRIEDSGRGIPLDDLPRATLQRGFTTAGTLGHGFTIMLEVCDRLHLATSTQGSCVIIEQERTAPLKDTF